MEIIFASFSICLAAAAIILLLRLLCYRKQIDHIKEQLLFLKAEESNYMLTSVKGYVQMQKNTDIPQEKRAEYLRIVERRLIELGDILNQLFEYARLEAGEFPLSPQRLNIGNVFAEIVSMFYEDFTSKGVEPQIEIPRESMFIQADKHAISRILENLIKNALVHGEGNYHFSLTSCEGYAVITIANETGQIEEKDLQQIFERFYTTDQSRNRRTTGLGLAIAKEFTEQMGGCIEAFLQQGCFCVEVRFRTVLFELE